MSKRILTPILVFLVMLLLPVSASAQPPVYGVYGSVQMNSQDVPHNTLVTAKINGEVVATTRTLDSGYSLVIPGDYEGEKVSFLIGSHHVCAAEMVVWKAGWFDSLDLHSYFQFGPSVAGYYGTVMTGTVPAPVGSEINAWVNGSIITTTEVQDYGGTSVYSIQVEGPFSYENVIFTLGDQHTYIGKTLWSSGSYDRLDLISAWSCLVYDDNHNTIIEFNEMVVALMDYLTSDLVYHQMVEVLMCYLLG